MKLTAKQEAFAQAVASGKTQADAYRESYNCKGLKDAVLWVKASELAKSGGKVAVRIEELKAELAKKKLWTREHSVKILATIAAGKESTSQERVSAVKELNAMHGYYAPKKLDLDIKEVPKVEIILNCDN